MMPAIGDDVFLVDKRGKIAAAGVYEIAGQPENAGIFEALKSRSAAR